MGTLDEIRAEIVARRDLAQTEIDRYQADLRTIMAELAAHDRAADAVRQPELPFANPAPPTRAPRRDIAALVLDALDIEDRQMPLQIATRVNAQLRQVGAALARLEREGKAAGTHMGWVRVADREETAHE
jgi:hypothetical protein